MPSSHLVSNLQLLSALLSSTYFRRKFSYLLSSLQCSQKINQLMHFQKNVVTKAAHWHSQRVLWSFLCSDVTSVFGATGILPPPLTYAPRLRTFVSFWPWCVILISSFSHSPWVPRLAHYAKCRSAYIDVSNPYGELTGWECIEHIITLARWHPWSNTTPLSKSRQPSSKSVSQLSKQRLGLPTGQAESHLIVTFLY